MKKAYTAPAASVETFMVSNYFAAVCYTLGCNYKDANKVEKDVYRTYSDNPHGNQVKHTNKGCGNSANQYISVDDYGNVSIKELNSELGWLDCTVTSAGGANDIAVGSFVTWETSASEGRVWHHQGTAQAIFPDHPNRS